MSNKQVTGWRKGVLAAAVGLASAGMVQAQTAKPNIVFILADDLGWTDLQDNNANMGNGSDYHRTPHLSALAEAGISFTNAYACPLCAPTRATLMTGQSSARHGMYSVNRGDRGDADAQQLTAVTNRLELPGSAVTLAETLKSAGYDTYNIGKWHLGNDGEGTGPMDQGFDINFGGDHRGMLDTHFADGSGDFDLPNVNSNGKANQFFADRMTDRTISYLNERADRNDMDPFFLYYSMYSVHTPLQAPQENLNRLNGVPTGERHDNKTYAAMVENMDDNVGRLIEYLETTDDPRNPGQKLIANTLVVFTSDNGGLGGYDGTGITYKKGEITDQSPLKGGKGMLTEGGIRVPMIVRWDGQVQADAVSSTPVSFEDFYPTLASIVGADVPADHVIDGRDISPILRGETSSVDRDTLYWHYPGYLEADNGSFRATPMSVALYEGRWKLFYYYETGTWELYDLQNDLGETNNIIDEQSALANRIGTNLVNWLTETNADLPMYKGTSTPVAMPTAPIPEPATAGLLGIGGWLLAQRRTSGSRSE